MQLITVLACVLGLLVAMGGAAFAYWRTIDSADGGQSRADILPMGATPIATTTPVPTKGTVTLTFSAAETTIGHFPIPAKNYLITRFAAGGGWGTAVTAVCSGTDPITCTESEVPEGRWQYADTPTYGTNWFGTPSVRSAPVTVDTTSPVVAVSTPVSGTTYGTNWSGMITGSAGDTGAGVVGVGVSVQSTVTGLWWNGVSFAATAQTFLAASGTTSWTFALPSWALTSGSGYRVTATATDGTGNVGLSAITSFVFDNTLPVVVIGYPVSGNAYGPNWSGAIGGSVADPDANLTDVSLTIADSTAGTWWNGAGWQSTAASVGATGTSTWSYPLAVTQLTDDHRYAVVAVATDAVGNIGISSTSSFRVDVAALSVAISYPVTTAAYGGNWTGTLVGTAADSHPNLAGVTLTITDTTAATTWTGSAWSGTPSTVTAAGTTSWDYPLASNQLTSGHRYTVAARAMDLAGNTGTSTAVSWTYNSTAPTSVITSPVSGTGYGANWAGTLAGAAAAGAGLSVASVALSIENTSAATYWTGASWTTTATSVVADGTGNWTYPLPSTALTSGATYTLRATVTDNLGNTSTTAVTWTYSTTPPAVAITSPVGGTSYGANWTGTITGTAGAAATSVKVSVQNSTTGLWWNGSAFSATAATLLPVSGSSSWTYPLPASALSTGSSYVIAANVTDAAGNAGTSGGTTFAFTTTAPTGAISYPVTGTTYGADWVGTIAGTATAGSGLTVASVRLTIQNTSAATYWTGTGWSVTPTTVSATGAASWSYPLAAAALSGANSYAVAATVTDSAGNSATGTGSTWAYAAAPGKLKITSTAVSGAASGAASLGPITVQAQDSVGNPVTAPAGGITVAVSSNSSGATVFSASSGGAGTSSVLIPSGSSSVSFYFGDTKAGTPTISVTTAGASGGTQTATITAAAANKLVFGQQPTNAPRSTEFTPTVMALILDQFGNQTTSTAVVTMAIQSGPAAGGLSGGRSRQSVGGVATFPGLSISGGSSAGTYVLQATASGLVSVSSNSFVITDR